MNIANQRWMAACGFISMIILLIGLWVIAGFVPPPSPNNTMEQTVAIYAQKQDRIRVGLIISLYGATLLMPWAVVISEQMRRIEGPSAPLSRLQLALGVMLVMEFLVATIFWLGAAFRPLQFPEITWRLHDLGGIMYVGLPVTTMLEATALGIVILMDKREKPVFPRWLAYLSFWAAASFTFGSLNYLTHTGPLAYNGLLAWWLGLTAFTLWIAAVSFCLLRNAIPNQILEEQAANVSQ
ncbi:hypothetical protein [Mycobacterium sp.]|uniref:hypothetical protein n=1 Tax=Mycobacterium sp. TaxID=1785 RepID=UPI0012053BB6|nr:hypothetical protein [Mycobacterium sp.]TAM68125.1 MAG: hypothetical protein EPN51_12525 [Mycobacterium sp.]